MTPSILNKYVAMLFMCLCQFGPSLAQVSLNNGLVFHLPFDGNFNDASGNGNITKPRNVTLATDCAGTPGSAAYFNGNNSLIEIPASFSLNSTELLTVSFWVYGENTTSDVTMLSRAKDDPASPKRLAYSFDLTSNLLPSFNLITPPVCQDYGNFIGSNLAQTGKWHSVIGVFDGVQMSLYLDGVMANQVALSFMTIQFCEADIPLIIGAKYPGEINTFKGKLDDIRIYNRVLNAEEIRALSTSCSISISCPAPTAFSTTKTSKTSVMVSWTGNPYSNSYEAEYKEATSDTWIKAFSTNTADPTEITGLLSGKTYDIRFRSRCAIDSSGWLSGQFTMTNGPACQPPSDLSANNISETQATVQWNVPTNGIGVNVQYAVKGTGSWVDIASERVDKFLDITGLNPGTEYEWRVQTACDAGPSDWVVSTFTTLGVAPCRPPFDLLPADISGNRAALKWTAWSGSMYYDVEYKESTSSNWIRTTPALFSYEIEYLDSLQPVTAYDWRVRSVCASGVSEWSVSSFITTSGQPIDMGIALVSDFEFQKSTCSSTQLTFTNKSVVTRTTISKLLWNFGDGDTSTLANPIHNYKKPGNYSVTLTIADDNGRSSAKVRQVTVTETNLSFANAGKNMVICSKEQIQLKASGGQKYEWSPCIGLSDCNTAEPLLTPGLNETYIVKVTNSDGCTDTASVFVRFVDPAKGIYIPNAFTPNNDGLNDVFKPLATLSISGSAECRIFDRFGNIVFYSADPRSGWDGNYKGQPAPAGSYPYMIRLNGQGACAAKDIKGTISLIR